MLFKKLKFNLIELRHFLNNKNVYYYFLILLAMIKSKLNKILCFQMYSSLTLFYAKTSTDFLAVVLAQMLVVAVFCCFLKENVCTPK